MLDHLDRKIKAGVLAYKAGLGGLANTLVQKSIVQSQNKAGSKANTYAKRTVSKAMGVSQKFIKSRVSGEPFKVIRAKSSGKAPLEGSKVTVRVRGRRIRLIHFSAKEKRTKRKGAQGVTARVWGKREHYKKAFIAPVRYSSDGQTKGVFVRGTAHRLPINQLYGPGPAREAERHEDEVIKVFRDEMAVILPRQLRFNIEKAMTRKPLKQG
jgi:hypothetical protein